MFAQSLVEYGSLSSAMAGVQSFVYDVSDRVAHLTPSEWIVVFLVIALAMIVVARR